MSERAKGSGRIRRSLGSRVAMAAVTGVILSAHCGPSPTSTNNGRTENFEYCWEVLRIFSIFQEQLPADPAVFADEKALYRSIGDPWTRYHDKDTAALYLAGITTTSGGIGILIDSVAAGIVITEVLANSPGAGAGLHEGDTITAINDTTLAPLIFSERTSLLHGDTGQVRTLTIRRGTQALTIAVTLGTYLAPSVFADSLDSMTAYIGITLFSDSTIMPGGTAAEFDRALDSSRWAVVTIVDLRGNRGGLVEQCIDVAGQFMAPGSNLVISHARDWDPYLMPDGMTYDTVWATTRVDGKALLRSFYVLIDDFTASASEIVVAGLRQHRPDIVLVGTRTFGKARSQYWFYYSPDSGLATVTFSLLRPQDGPEYDLVGIAPDHEIAAGEDALDVARVLINAASGTPKARIDLGRCDRIRNVRLQMIRSFGEPLGVVRRVR